MLPTPTSRANVTTVAHPLMYATHLSTAIEASALYVTTNCMENSYTSLDKNLPQQMYAANPSSTMPVVYQRGWSVKGVTDWRHGLTYVSVAYGEYILTPLLTSKLATLIRTPTDLSQWQRSCIGGKKMKKDDHSKHWQEQRKKISPFAISVYCMLVREALVTLVNLSQLMAAKMDDPITYVRDLINGRISISDASSYSRMIHRALFLGPLRDQEPDWYP